MKVRSLVTSAELDRLCAEALRKTELRPVYLNGEEFAAYIRVMAYAGSRMSETLTLRWDDVDWQARQLTIGASGRTKNNQVRRVDFNANLEAHLRAMSAQKAPDSEWLFPSPRRGETDRPAKTFRETLLLVRAKAGLPKFGFHDCRHHFISMCVMAGIDYMTIARWAGHQDGGILIGKVYGHLSNEHAQMQAGRLTFGPVLVNEASNQ
jgi:integrase